MKICSVEDCEKPKRTKGLCNKHYLRFWKTGTTDARIPSPEHGSLTGYTMRKCRCDGCVRAWREYQRDYQPAWADRNPELVRLRKQRSKLKVYGLTIEQYEAMVKRQGGCCAICQGPPEDGRTLSVDHNHTTGRVRSLLCSACNAAIGMLRENVTVALAAVDYLLVHGEIDSEAVA